MLLESKKYFIVTGFDIQMLIATCCLKKLLKYAKVGKNQNQTFDLSFRT